MYATAISIGFFLAHRNLRTGDLSWRWPTPSSCKCSRPSIIATRSVHYRTSSVNSEWWMSSLIMMVTCWKFEFGMNWIFNRWGRNVNAVICRNYFLLCRVFFYKANYDVWLKTTSKFYWCKWGTNLKPLSKGLTVINCIANYFIVDVCQNILWLLFV